MTVSAFAYGSGQSWFDPATGAVKQVSLYYYRAGTLDPITVFTTSDLSIPFPIPVLSTGYGKVPPIWVGEIEDPGYRVRVFDQYSQLVEDVDNIPGPMVPSSGGGGGGGTINPGDPRLYATGDIVMGFSNAQPRTGFVLCNGKEIGPTGSPNVTAGGRANDDTEALFKYLWGQDVHGMLAIVPSRGTTADGDWIAKKGLKVPDFMGRVPVGMDAMGTSPGLARLAGVTFTAGQQDWVGATAGAARRTLTVAQIPAHNHSISETVGGHLHSVTIGGHTHVVSGSTSAAGGHTHTGDTDEEANHTHTVPSGGGTVSLAPQAPVVSSAAAGGAQTTGAAGKHTHNLNIDAVANHSHTVSLTAASAGGGTYNTTSATAGITSASVGSGETFDTVQPLITVCFFMKL